MIVFDDNKPTVIQRRATTAPKQPSARQSFAKPREVLPPKPTTFKKRGKTEFATAETQADEAMIRSELDAVMELEQEKVAAMEVEMNSLHESISEAISISEECTPEELQTLSQSLKLFRDATHKLQAICPRLMCWKHRSMNSMRHPLVRTLL